MISFADLKGKVVIITGGNGILGTAIAESLLDLGARVALLGRNAEKIEASVAALRSRGGTALALVADVLDEAALYAARECVLKEWGQIDALINAAGGNDARATTQQEKMGAGKEGSFFTLDPAGFRQVFDVNFQGTLLPSQVFADAMLENGGSILNISSMAAYKPMTKVPAYAAAKAGISNLTQWMSVHLAERAIRVNAIAPGFFLTEQNRSLLTNPETGELTARGHKIIAHTPLARFGEAEELQGAVCYLLSDLARFVTGVILPIDGGFQAYSGV